jgi:hypothetical protein
VGPRPRDDAEDVALAGDLAVVQPFRPHHDAGRSRGEPPEVGRLVSAVEVEREGAGPIVPGKAVPLPGQYRPPQLRRREAEPVAVVPQQRLAGGVPRLVGDPAEHGQPHLGPQADAENRVAAPRSPLPGIEPPGDNREILAADPLRMQFSAVELPGDEGQHDGLGSARLEVHPEPGGHGHKVGSDSSAAG